MLGQVPCHPGPREDFVSNLSPQKVATILDFVLSIFMHFFMVLLQLTLAK